MSQGNRLRCEIIAIVQPDGEATQWYAVETYRYDKTVVCVTAFTGEPTAAEKVAPALADAPDGLDLPFASVRGVATALLRAYYHEVPASASRVPVDDLVEHFTHLDEFLRGAVHNRKGSDIANAMQLERERNDALRDVDKERKQVRFWEARYQYAAKWAVHNAAKVKALRAEVRILNQKVKDAEAEMRLQTEHSLTSWVLDAMVGSGWTPPTRSRVCDCVPGQLCDLHADGEEPNGHPG